MTKYLFVSIITFLVATILGTSVNAQSGLTDIFKDQIKKHSKNHIYDIVHYDIDVAQEPHKLIVNNTVEFNINERTRNQFAFFIATGCSIDKVTDKNTDMVVNFKVKKDMIMDAVFFSLPEKNGNEWIFSYTCGPQSLFDGDLIWFGPEGVQAGMIPWYPDNIVDNGYSYNLHIKTLKGFVAASSGLLISGDDQSTEYDYKGFNSKIFLFIKKYKIVRRELGGVEYQYFVDKENEPAIGYDRLTEITDFFIKLYSDLFSPYPSDSFTIMETVKPGENGNWGLGDGIAINHGLLSGEKTTIFWYASHEIAHSWFGNLLYSDMNGLSGFTETMAQICETLAYENRPHYITGDTPASSWKKSYADFVRDTDNKGVKELSILQARYNLPGLEMYHYLKSPLVLRMLRRKIGDEAFLKLLKEYVIRNSGKPCSFEEFVRLTDEIAGKEAAQFLFNWFKENERIDYAITEAVQEKKGHKYVTRIKIESLGTIMAEIPIDIAFGTKHQNDILEDYVKIESNEPVLTYEYTSDSEIAFVKIDPFSWLADSNPTNDILEEKDIVRK